MFEYSAWAVEGALYNIVLHSERTFDYMSVYLRVQHISLVFVPRKNVYLNYVKKLCRTFLSTLQLCEMLYPTKYDIFCFFTPLKNPM